MVKTMRRNIAFIMMLTMVINLIPVITLTVSAAGGITPSTSLPGLGTAVSPFLIASVADLAYMRDQINAGGNITPTGGGADVIAKSAHYRLTVDIVLGYWQDDGNGIVEDGEIYNSESGGTAYSESNWAGIAFSSRISFSGTFNGANHTVSGIYINEPSSDYHGLFGNVVNGIIKNVGVKDSYIKGNNYVGGIAGCNAGSGGKVENCYNTGSVSGSNWVGGIVGYNVNWGTAQCCYNLGNVSGNQYVGGILGDNVNKTKLLYCYNVGSISGADYVGGIVGINRDMLQYCYNVGSISGNSKVGGITGYNNASSSTLQYCYNTGNVNGNSSIGGITGYSAQGTLTDNYYDKQVCPIGGSSGNDREGKIEGKLTSELTSGIAFSDQWTSGETGIWNFTEGLYPRLTGYVVGVADYKMDETDAAYVSASPIFLAATDTAGTVKYDFTLSTENGVSWSSDDESVISIDGSNATIEVDGTATLTASLGGVTKSITLTVDMTPPTLQGATRDNDNQITLTLSEPCLNLANENDGGFTVAATGTEETFEVSGTAQGIGASQVVLTVADMGSAKAIGITITYTAGENGTITDIAGNPLATDNIGVAITPWAPKLNTPEGLTWDTKTPAKATWNAVENASGYTVQLYKDGIASGSPITGITNTFYDFTPYIAETGLYTFTVTATRDDAEYSNSDVSPNSPEYSYSAGGPGTSLFGLGTAASPFLIASAVDLAYMRDQINAGGNIKPTGGGADVIAKTAHYKLTADIVLGYWQDDGDKVVEDGEIYDSESGGATYSESNWTPIGNTSMFKGTFDGDDHTVSGIYINETVGFQGLFDYADGATIKNVGVTDSYICGKSAAGIVGYIKNSTKLTNCYNTGSIIGVAYVGGVVSQSYNNNALFGCYNTGSVKGSQEVVGIPGIGGVVGYNSSNSTISGCYNTGNVNGSKRVGGVVGDNFNSTISGCYNAGNVNGGQDIMQYGGVGGVVGYNSGTISGCFNTGSVSGGTEGVGGVAGGIFGTVENSYNVGSVSGTYINSRVGGVVGTVQSGPVQYCYNAGSVSGTSVVGGVVGTNTTSTVQNCYYDKQVCPIGGINGGDVAGSAEGKLTSEITNGTTFTDWISGDTGTWNFAEGLYPRLTGYVDESTDYKMDETDAAFVSASPVFLVATDTATTVKSNFTLSTANGVSWVSGGGGIISIDGNNATLEGDGSTALTASLRGITKSVSLTVDITPPILQNAVRDSGTQITVTLSEPCLNLTKENDGGFLVTKTGTEETYTISGIVQGADASYVVLTVDNMAAAGVKGITVTYTAGANGTITDISGNPLATNSIGVVISPWAPKLDTPGSLIWDTTNPAKATWGAVENASGYTVQLHKDGIASGSPITGITDTYYDFSAVITETDTYTFTVQAIGDGATYSDGDMSSKSPDYSYTVPVYISEAEVNMAVPTAGAAPQTAEQIEMATSNADFTVAGIVWHEALTAGDRFKAGQVYTATVTLTSKNGKEFQTAAFTPTVTGASSVGTTTTAGTETGNKVTFTVTFTATDVQSMTAISVTAQPDKMAYTECKDGILNLGGMVVTETYNDGTTKEIAFEDGTAPGYTTVPANGAVLINSVNNSNPVTITHTESGKTATTDNLTVNTPPTYTVTFKNWNGSELKTETVEHGSGATAPAEPAREGYHFTGWDADFSKIISDLTVTAEFAINEYTLTYIAGENGSITGTATQTVSHGSDGTAVTAVPDAGYHFVKWSDDVTTATRTDTGVTGDITVTATFTLNEYTLIYTAGENGSITGAATQTVSYGSDGTAVTAVPDAGYHFVKWSDDVTTATRTDENVTGNISVTAEFAINEYTLTYTAGENGSISGTTPQAVRHGSDGTAVTAVPDTGYHFVKWSDDLTTATRTDTGVTGDITVTATFALNEYTLTYTAEENGSITGTATQTVSHGSDGTAVTAVPDAGYHFVKWSDDVTTATRTDTGVTGNISVTAEFAINTYTVTFRNWNGDEIKTQTVEHGSGATAPDEPTREGYHFTGWDADFSNITVDLTVTATFAINTYTVTYTAGENGSITGTATQTVSHGSDGTAVTAVPDAGYHFVKWSDDVTTATRMDENITGNISVTAEFAINTYTVTFKNWNGDELKTQIVEHGSGATAPDEPTREGYHFTGWDADFSNVTSDLTITAVFAINEYTLTYTSGANGSITGTATQAVSYGSDGTAVTAVPDAGYHFVKWSDDVTTATRTDTGVTGNISVTAEFAINEYTLTYAAGENGSISGTATQTVSHGSDGTVVTAVPDAGYHFVKWSDDITTAARTDTGVAGDITVTATFAINEYTLTYTAGENGSISGITPQSANHGSDGTAVTAVPDTGYHLVKWSDDVTTATRMDENITGNISVTAEFAINTYTVTFKNWDGSDLKTEIVEHGSGATAPAEPTREGYHFTGWDADFSKIISDLTVTATFAINTYTVTYTAGENGSISGITPQTVSHGSDGTAVTAVPDAGYHFVKWSDDVTTATRTDTDVTEDITVTAEFAINEYTLTYIAGENGSITGTATQTVSHGNDGTAITAVPDEGYHFVKWSDDVTAATRMDENITGNISVTAEFAINTYTVTFKNWDGSDLKTEIVEHGSGATAPAEPTRGGYHFTGWDTDFSKIISDLTVTATFAINKYTLAYTAGENGSITGTATQTVSHGSDGAAVTAVPDAGYHFVKWSDDVTTATRTDTGVTGDITVTAEFAINEYTLTYTAGENGRISGITPQSVSHGSDGTAVTAVPDTGYHFVKWSDDVTTATRTDTGVTGDITVTAEFAINEYTLTYIAGENGSITGTATQTVSHGNDGTAITAVPDEGYHFVKWSDDVTTATRTDTGVIGDITVTATFALNEYTLTYTAGENGSVTGTATQTVSHGSDGTAVTAVPDEGCHFVKWSDNVTTATRTDENVMENISVTAEFAKTEVTSFTVKAQPTKLTYTAGETLDLAGLIATLTYNDGRTVDVAYAQFRANGITANPDQGTTMEVAIHNGQAIILTCITHTATTGNLTVSAAPTYAIALSETGIHTFTALTVGYTPVAPITVTVTKTGTGNITSLSVALSGTDADDFTLGALDAATLDSTTTLAEFTMKPNDALAPGTYTATVMVTADNGISQSFNICFTVNAPSAPTIQSAVAGNTHVNITWSSVPGATEYKIYQSTVSGSYGAVLATVSDPVYNYDAAGLSNGTTYFFVVRASIGIYDSMNSNEVSSTPQIPAPGAPVLQTAVAGDEHVNLTWSEVEGSIGYKIYASTTSGLYTSPVDTVAGSVYSCDVTGLTNGTAYYFVVIASNPGGDSGYSNEISATPQVSAPSAPTGLTAKGENGKVILSWNSTTEATGYKIYQSEVAGSYGTVLMTVAESVYSYEITGLTNGVVYYFVIKATNAGGDSPYSAEVTVIPVTVPGAPTNVAAAAGNGQVTVSFTPPADNGGSTITGYTVTSNPGNFTAEGTGTTITVTGLSNWTAYTFTVTASNAAGTGSASEVSNEATPYRRSSGGSTPSTPPEQPADTGADILVNGKTETAATATTTQEGDKTITAIVVDDKKVEKRLEQEGNNAVVTIPIISGADVVIGTLNGQTVKNMESKDAVLEIKTGQVTYTLPAFQINIDAVSGQIGKHVELKDIAVSVKISESAEDTVKIALDTADKNNYQIIVKPIGFEITCSSGSKTVEVSKFSAYVERMVAIPDGVDPSKITTGVILNSDGTFSHVPTAITMIDGKYYAKINSLTNSTYLLIYCPKSFKDVGRHWAEKDVNDMASRLVVSGIGDDKFEPDRDITRAEFAAIVVRALGLMSPGKGKDAFVDVTKKDWYYDAVSIAYEYGIISGYGNGKFGPDDKITREQAMTMIARAMEITGSKVELADDEADKLLTSFTDANSVAEYAKANVASCVKAGIVSGRNGKQIAPKDNITRAEVAVIVQRLLRNSKLI